MLTAKQERFAQLIGTTTDEYNWACYMVRLEHARLCAAIIQVFRWSAKLDPACVIFANVLLHFCWQLCVVNAT